MKRMGGNRRIRKGGRIDLPGARTGKQASQKKKKREIIFQKKDPSHLSCKKGGANWEGGKKRLRDKTVARGLNAIKRGEEEKES